MKTILIIFIIVVLMGFLVILYFVDKNLDLQLIDDDIKHDQNCKNCIHAIEIKESIFTCEYLRYQKPCINHFKQ